MFEVEVVVGIVVEVVEVVGVVVAVVAIVAVVANNAVARVQCRSVVVAGVVPRLVLTRRLGALTVF